MFKTVQTLEEESLSDIQPRQSYACVLSLTGGNGGYKLSTPNLNKGEQSDLKQGHGMLNDRSETHLTAIVEGEKKVKAHTQINVKKRDRE